MTDENSLAIIGAEAVQLLTCGDISTLSTRFGYAASLGRESDFAIQQDLLQCLIDLQSNNLVPASQPKIGVKYFNGNKSGLFALVECLIPTDTGAQILIELIVSSKGLEKHITLEQLSIPA